MWNAFQSVYFPEDGRLQLLSHEVTTGDEGASITAQVLLDGEHRTVVGSGNGPIAAFVHALSSDLGIKVDVLDYAEHAIAAGTDATAVAYVEAQGDGGEVKWGVDDRGRILDPDRIDLSLGNRQSLAEFVGQLGRAEHLGLQQQLGIRNLQARFHRACGWVQRRADDRGDPEQP